MRIGGILCLAMLIGMSDFCVGEEKPRPVPEKMPLGEFGDGVVVDEQGMPVAGVEVSGTWIYYPQSSFNKHPPYLVKMKTDAAGMFSLYPSPEIQVQKLNLIVRDGKGNIGTASQSSIESPKRMMRVQLAPELYYHVEVVDEEGNPCPGVEVRCDTILTSSLTSVTDEKGFAKVVYSNDAYGSSYLIATLPGKGFAFERCLNRPAVGRTPPIVKMTLLPVQPRKVQVVDSQDRPIARAIVAITNMQFKNTHASGIASYFTTTDDHGRVTLDLPEGQSSLTLYKHGYCSRHCRVQREDFLTKNQAAKTTKSVVLPEQVTLDTTIVNQTGKSLYNYQVEIRGTSRWYPRIQETIRFHQPDPFQIHLPVDSHVAIWVTSGNHRSEVVPLSIRSGSSPGPLHLTIEPNRKIQGRLLAVSDGKPIADRKINVASHMVPAAKLAAMWSTTVIPDLAPPKYDEFRSISLEPVTDEDGYFEFATGPGEFRLQEASREEPVTLVVGLDAPTDVTIWGAKFPWGQVTGQVTLADAAAPVLGNVEVICQPQNTLRKLRPFHLDDRGKFHAPVSPVPQTVLISSDQTNLAGSATIAPNARSVVVPLKKTVSVEGQFTDTQKGTPVSQGRLYLHLMVAAGRGKWLCLKQQRVEADFKGNFESSGLIPGAQYWLSPRPFTQADRSEAESPDVLAFCAPESGTLDLGNLYDEVGQKQDSQALDLRAAFAPPLTLSTRLIRARLDAMTAKRNLLVIVGSPTDPLSRELVTLTRRFDISQAPLHQALRPFQQIWIDAQQITPQVQQKWKLPEDGQATLLVFDTKRNLLGRIKLAELREENRWSMAPLLEFLKKHSPEVPDARQRFQDAVDAARAHDKRVLVTYGDYGERALQELELVLQENASELSQFCVVCQLDSRMQHVTSVTESLWPGGNDHEVRLQLVAPQSTSAPLPLHVEPICFRVPERRILMEKLRVRTQNLLWGDAEALLSPANREPVAPFLRDVLQDPFPQTPSFRPSPAMHYGPIKQVEDPFGPIESDPFGGPDDDPFAQP